MTLFRTFSLALILSLPGLTARAQSAVQSLDLPDESAQQSPAQDPQRLNHAQPPAQEEPLAVSVNAPANQSRPTHEQVVPVKAAKEQPIDTSGMVGITELPDSVAPALPPIEGKSVDDNLLPLKLPGYELRQLDKRKKLMYNIKGQWVEASLPVYFYYPTDPANKDRALQLLRKVYDDVLALGEKPQWTAAEFRNVLVSLDSALSLLEASGSDNKAAPSLQK